jgi:hypothetical protein
MSVLWREGPGRDHSGSARDRLRFTVGSMGALRGVPGSPPVHLGEQKGSILGSCASEKPSKTRLDMGVESHPMWASVAA